MNQEDKQRKRNQRLILFIAAISFIPFVFAWLFAKNPQWLSGRSNLGELIIPPIVTQRSDLSGYDEFSVANLHELNGHWVMMNFISNDQCNEICRDAIHKTQQIRLMTNKDLVRIRRVVVIFNVLDTEKIADWWQKDSRLLHARAEGKLLQQLKTIVKGENADGMLLLMDPFGNLMMKYQPGFDPYNVKTDLKKLLRISQIG